MVEPVDLLIEDAWLVATMDEKRRELAGGWVAVDNGLVVALGGGGEQTPAARRRVNASGCLVTPGLINTHHHLFQNHYIYYKLLYPFVHSFFLYDYRFYRMVVLQHMPFQDKLNISICIFYSSYS